MPEVLILIKKRWKVGNFLTYNEKKYVPMEKWISLLLKEDWLYLTGIRFSKLEDLLTNPSTSLAYVQLFKKAILHVWEEDRNHLLNLATLKWKTSANKMLKISEKRATSYTMEGKELFKSTRTKFWCMEGSSVTVEMLMKAIYWMLRSSLFKIIRDKRLWHTVTMPDGSIKSG